MAKKKSEIYSSLWESCNKLRGGMDSSQYKDYILVLLFVKYVSDKAKSDQNSIIDVPNGASFDDMVALKGNKEIGDGINKIIAELAKANDLQGVIDVADFNDDTKLGKGKDMVDKLTDLIAIFQSSDLDFSKNTAEGDDILGDAYEYLMSHFATESGKSKGQFYTPAEVSRIMAKVIGVSQSKSPSDTIYDPTCGSGSLLLKVADEAPSGITIYGQEMDNATAGLAKMNMILHNHATAEIHQDNTLSNPFFKDNETSLKKFDYVVANPPFSFKSWTNGFSPSNDKFSRFEYGVPPEKNGDYAFLLHILKSLKSTGKGAVILPHGVLFRGHVEAQIRTNIIQRRFIKGIIALPPNLFFGTGIPACIIVLDKENAETRKGIFMIDAGKGFVKDGNKNRLREQDIRKIVDVFNGQLEIDKFSKMVGFDEIEKNEYNLNIPRYIDSQEPEDIQDIEAHLQGGIPNFDIENLNKYWDVYPSLKNELFMPSDRASYSCLCINKDEVKNTIYNNIEFVKFSESYNNLFNEWKSKNIQDLRNLQAGFKPKLLIPKLADDILATFANTKLIDKYDIYQHLMSYWNETMQDDAYILARIGWKIELTEVKKDKNKTELVCDLVPKELIINRYFQKEKQELENLEQQLEDVISKKEEIIEENSGEEGLLEDLKSDKGTISKGVAQSRYNVIKNDKDNQEEAKVLKEYLAILDTESKTKTTITKANDELYKKVIKKYSELTEDEIKILVIEDKWMTSLSDRIKTEMENISQCLTQRIKELGERYNAPLPTLMSDIQELTQKVGAHLEKMGFACR